MPSTNKNEQSQEDQNEQSQESGANDAQGSQDSQSPLADLDLSKLDLRIEAVEERISPSETNVFDK